MPLDPLEIIVVDSSPVAASLPQHPCVRLIHLPKRAYPGEARNVGWKAAQGEYLLFVDADVALTDKSRQFVKNHMDSKARDMAFGIYSKDCEGYNDITRTIVAIQRYRFLEVFNTKTVRYGQSSHLLMPRALYKEMGFFNPHLRMHEDKEICIRACNAGVAVNTYAEFEADHLKVFSLNALIKDHSDKSYLAIKQKIENPAIFSKIETLIEPNYKATWLASFFVPFVALALAFFSPLAALLLFVVTLVAPLLLCHRTFATLPSTSKLNALLVWPVIGGAITLGVGLGVISGIVGRGKKLVRWLHTAAVSLFRILAKTGMPINLIHFITARCNLRCHHCFYKDTLDKKDPGEQSLEQLDKTTKEAGPLLWYALAGGEPFVRGDIADIYNIISTNCNPLMFSVPTNGWYTEKTFLSTLKMLQLSEGKSITIQISLDGPEKLHDDIRGEDSWRRAKETFTKLTSLQSLYPNLSLGIITVVNKDNYHCYPDFIKELIQTFNPNQIAINLYRESKDNNLVLDNAIIEAYNSACNYYADALKSKKIKGLNYFGGRLMRAKEIVQKELIYQVAKHDEFVTPCLSGTLSYVIWENGDIGPCEVLADKNGNVLGESNNLRDIVKSKKSQALRKQIKDTQCKCTYECGMTINTLFSMPLAKKTYIKAISNEK